VAGCCEHGKVPIKRLQYPELLSRCWFLDKDWRPWNQSVSQSVSQWVCQSVPSLVDHWQSRVSVAIVLLSNYQNADFRTSGNRTKLSGGSRERQSCETHLLPHIGRPHGQPNRPRMCKSWAVLSANCVTKRSVRFQAQEKDMRFASRSTGLPNYFLHARFDVFTAVTMNNDIFWDNMAPCSSCTTFRRNNRLSFQGENSWVPPWLAARIYLTTDGEESLNGISIVVSTCYRGDIVDKPLLRWMWWLTSSREWCNKCSAAALDQI
jgi:hypothetical protein